MVSLTDAMNRGCDQRVFLHDYLASGARADTVNALGYSVEHQFSERALLLSQPQDLVIAPALLDPVYLDYLNSVAKNSIFGRVIAPSSGSIGVADSITAAANCDTELMTSVVEQLKSDAKVRLSCYYRSTGTEEFCQALSIALGREIEMEGGSASSTARCNQKELLYGVARTENLGLAPGGLVERCHAEGVCDFVNRVCEHVRAIAIGGKSAIVRGCTSQSGLDTLVVNSDSTVESLARWLASRPNQTHYLVEEFVCAKSSPNVQTWVSQEGKAEALAIVTDQRLDFGVAHYGNSFPHNVEQCSRVNELTRSLNGWIARNDYSGSVGFDLMLLENSPKPLLAEVNARTNGATYFISLFEKLNESRRTLGQAPLKAWVSHKKMPVRFQSFETLFAATHDLLYRAERNEGCFPVGSGLLPFGYVMMATFADSVDEAVLLEAEFRERTR